MKKTFILLTLMACCFACTGNQKKTTYMAKGNEKLVRLETSMGNITVKLYDETPIHRDNFIKLAKAGQYDGLLFHRVIKDFMVQGGDVTSKDAPMNKQLGAGDLG